MTEPKKYWAVVDKDGQIPDILGEPCVYTTIDKAIRNSSWKENIIPVAIVPYDQAECSITKADIMRAAKASTAKLKQIGAYEERNIMKETDHEDRL